MRKTKDLQMPAKQKVMTMGYTRVTRPLRATVMQTMESIKTAPLDQNIDYPDEEPSQSSSDAGNVVTEGGKEQSPASEETVELAAHFPVLSKSGKPQTFLVNGHVIATAYVKDVPNKTTEATFNQLPDTVKEDLKIIPVGRFYEYKDDYKFINSKLVEMYNMNKQKHYCAICTHLNIPIIHHKGDSWHEFFTKYKLDTHYTRFHCKPFECNVCGKLFATSKSLRAHRDSQKKRPTMQEHIDEEEVVNEAGLSAFQLAKKWRAADIAAKKSKKIADKAKKLALEAASAALKDKKKLSLKKRDQEPKNAAKLN